MARKKAANAVTAENLTAGTTNAEAAHHPPMVRIILPVEPEPGRRFEAIINDPVEDWAKLDSRAWSERREDGTYVLRDDHFRYDKLVKDAVRANIQKDEAKEVPTSAPITNGEPVVVLLESPHKDEYSRDLALFEAQYPLNNALSRVRMCRQLKRLAEAAGLRWADLLSKHVVLVNPVPFQASMHRFFAYKEPLHKELRDQVWCALFHQVLWFKVSLRKRLCEYSPVLILNGCTKNLQDDAHDLVCTLPFHTERVTNHPSWWTSKVRLLRSDEVRE